VFHQSNSVELKKCLACGSSDLKLTLDLNNQPLANSYKNTKNEVQEQFPLAINRCENCYHVQLTHAVKPELMFKEYLYVSGTSNTMKEHFKWFADFTIEYYEQYEICATTVFDIGCNDGSQLDAYRNMNMKTVGIDPAENLAEKSMFKGHDIYVDFFAPNFILNHDKTYDIITAQNVFAHNYDPLTFMLCAKKIMNENSLFFVQTSQADMIMNNEFDTIYHEHISFYNINSMYHLCQRANLHLIDVVKCPLHGNSYVFVISKNGIRSRPSHISNLIEMEKKIGLLTDETYVKYAEKCNSVVDDLRKVINSNTGIYKIVGYGAAAKGMTLLNYSGIHLDYIIDDNPLKQGKFTPGSNIEICSIDRLENETLPILFIPLAWNFFNEIKAKIKDKRSNSDDKFCTYFPRVEISS
jgi:2-polyprenyl-3-methyl-5-hydroxy-6-metoxy-1,4-benzoquinol methylase